MQDPAAPDPVATRHDHRGCASARDDVRRAHIGRAHRPLPLGILLARLFATFPLLCPQCGAELRLTAFVTAAEPVARILTRLGEPAEPPRITPARGPPAWADLLAPLPDWGALAQPAPEFEFDQRISW